MLLLLTLGSLIVNLRQARGLSQAALANVAGIGRSTLALVETRADRTMYPSTSRMVMEALAAAAPLTEEQCAQFLELSGLSTASRGGVLSPEDRAREIELGVLLDPSDADGRLRTNRHAFATYGPRVARVRDVGLDQLARALPTNPDASTAPMVLTAHRWIDDIAAAGGILAVIGVLLPLVEDAKAGRRVGAPRELNAPNPVMPPRVHDDPVPDKHTAYPAEGRVVTEYSPGDPPSPAAPPPVPQAHVPPRPKARRKSG